MYHGIIDAEYYSEQEMVQRYISKMHWFLITCKIIFVTFGLKKQFFQPQKNVDGWYKVFSKSIYCGISCRIAVT